MNLNDLYNKQLNKDILVEFAPAGGGQGGNYFQALASAWYNGVFDTGSLQKGIKSQEDVERLLNRGIVCPDGKTRKLHIDYNSDFDGVEIYSDDYYNHGDESGELDSRTGQPWGPYDFMEFKDEELDEGVAEGSLNEFAPDSNDGGEEDALHKYARMWWAGDEATQMQIERALAKMGWEIGEDEGGYDNGGVFVVRAGDENGNSYQSWAAEDLAEAKKKKKKKSSKSLRGYFFPGYAYYGAGDSGEGGGDGGGGGESINRGMAEDVQVNDQNVDVNVVIDKLQNFVSNAEQQIQNADYDQQIRYATIVRDRALQALEMVKQGGNTPEAAVAAFRYMQTGDQGMTEATKNKNNDDSVKDVVLQRAIAKSKAEFPTATSGLEALAKSFMQDQEKDQQNFEKIRRADSRRDELLSKIRQIDKTQNQEIDDLEQDKNSLEQQLQQIQNINAALEKTVAAMSGRKPKEKSTATAKTAKSTPTIKPGLTQPKVEPPKEPTPPGDAIKATAAQLTAPSDPMSAMATRITGGDSALINKVSGQAALPFEPTGNVLEPTIPQQQANPRFAAARRDASDAEVKQYADLTTKIARDALLDPEKAQAAHRVHEGNKTQQSAQPEADYGDDYQQMVLRLKKLAGAGPLKTVYDPNKRVYKNIPTAVQPKK